MLTKNCYDMSWFEWCKKRVRKGGRSVGYGKLKFFQVHFVFFLLPLFALHFLTGVFFICKSQLLIRKINRENLHVNCLWRKKKSGEIIWSGWKSVLVSRWRRTCSIQWTLMSNYQNWYSDPTGQTQWKFITRLLFKVVEA